MDLFLFVDDEGLFTVLPLHPETPGVGGPVTLRLSSDTASVDFDLSLDPIPAAPGAFDGFVETMTSELENRAETLGTSLELLSATSFADLDDAEAIIKLVSAYVDDGTDLDLESLPAHEGLTPEEGALADAILARIDPMVLIPAADARRPASERLRPRHRVPCVVRLGPSGRLRFAQGSRRRRRAGSSRYRSTPQRNSLQP